MLSGLVLNDAIFIAWGIGIFLFCPYIFCIGQLSFARRLSE